MDEPDPAIEPDATEPDAATGPDAWFDRWAHRYDADRRLLIACFDDFYGTAAELASLGRHGPVRVLDLGAGTGLVSSVLARRLPEASFVLLDESPAMLGGATERLAPLGDRVETVVADLRDPLPEGPFDAVVSALAIHHLTHEEKADLYLRAARCLAPGGVFVNAEQVSGPTPATDRLYRERWRRDCIDAGATDEVLAAADERMAIDLPASVPDQLAMLRDAGLIDVDCPYQAWRFAVLVGWRPRS